MMNTGSDMLVILTLNLPNTDTDTVCSIVTEILGFCDAEVQRIANTDGYVITIGITDEEYNETHFIDDLEYWCDISGYYT